MTYHNADITLEGLLRQCRALKNSEIALCGGRAIIKVLAEIYECSESKIRYTLKHFRALYKDYPELEFSQPVVRGKGAKVTKKTRKQKLLEEDALDFFKRKKEMLAHYDEILKGADWFVTQEVSPNRKDLVNLKFCSQECRKHLLESHEFYLSFKLWNLTNKLHPKLPKFLMNISEDLKESIEQHANHKPTLESLEKNMKILSKKSFKKNDICIVMKHLENAQEYFSKNLL